MPEVAHVYGKTTVVMENGFVNVALSAAIGDQQIYDSFEGVMCRFLMIAALILPLLRILEWLASR